MLRLVVLLSFLLGYQPGIADSQDVLKISKQALDDAAQLSMEPVTADRSMITDALNTSQRALKELDLSKPHIPSIPKLDLLNIPTPKVDINNMATKGQNLLSAPEEKRYESQVMVFISTSMPEKTIKNYFFQSREINAALVLRGFVNDSLQDTQLYLSKFIDKDNLKATPSILIDPTLFERFEIQHVPVTVVTESQIKPCIKDSCPTPVYHKVSGDVSINWALDLVSRQSSSQISSTLNSLSHKRRY